MDDIRFKISADVSGLNQAGKAFDNLSKAEEELLSVLKQINAQLGASSAKITTSSNATAKNAKQAASELSNLGKVATSVASYVGGVFALDKAIEAGKRIIEVTSQFQKLQAVLANALGSQKAGQIAFENISSAAAKTNFSVLELTDTYVKFANRGLKLTTEEIFNLTDLANSTGKSLDQLTEAALDAFSGENERLKEFGITAKKTGETTQFTFKGITTEVKNSQEAVKEYILGLGDLEGVSGSTAAISQTLEGRISNLGDALDNLFFTIGNSSSVPFGKFLGFLTAGIQGIGRLIQGQDELIRKQGLKELGEDAEKLPKAIAQLAKDYEQLGLSTEEAARKAREYFQQDAQKEVTNYSNRLTEVDKRILELTENIKEQQQLLRASGSPTFGAVIPLQKELETLQAQRGELANQLKVFLERKQVIEDTANIDNKGVSLQVGLIQELQAKIKALREEQEKSTDEKRVLSINGEVKKLQDRLDYLLGRTKDLKKATEDWKKQYEEIQRITTQFQINQDAFAIDEEQRLKKQAEDRQEFLDNRLNDVQKAAQDEIDFNLKWKKELEDREREHQERMQAIREEAAATFGDFINASFELSAAFRQKDLDDAQLKREEELKRVGDDKQAQSFINEKFNRQEREQKKRQAQADKLQGLFNVGLNTIVAVSKSIAVSPETFGLPFSAFAAAQGAIQLALLAAKPLPAYKNGVLDLQGPGTGTSDSITARLSKGESVMTNRETKSFLPTFKAIRENRIDPAILNSVAMGKTPPALIHAHPDYQRLEAQFVAQTEEMQSMRKVMEKIKITNLNADINGLSLWVQDAGGVNKTKILNNQFPV